MDKVAELSVQHSIEVWQHMIQQKPVPKEKKEEYKHQLMQLFQGH
jgi:hypothetical protein